MSQENVELLYRLFDAFNRRDMDAFLALGDPDVELYSRIHELEGGGPFRGHDGLRSWWETMLGMSPDFSTEIEEARDLGDVVIARLRLRGHGKRSGEMSPPMEVTTWQVTEWRDKKCVRWRNFGGEGEALEAVGLRE
jgi:ketosteroid isomerase-like protein